MESKTARMRLEVRGKPYWMRLSGGVSLGYRRTVNGTGTWSVRLADGKQGNRITRIALADDQQRANGKTVMTFAQARDAALRFGQGEKADEPVREIVTVADAIEAYRINLAARGGDKVNVSRLRHNLSQTMLNRPVALLNVAELSKWRDDKTKEVSAATVNRLMKILKATLNLAATKDLTLSKRAWEVGLKTIPGAIVADNVVLPDSVVFALIDATSSDSFEFGLMVETLAMTGARLSQVAQCQVRDLVGDRLMIPSSKKGVNKTITRVAVPIPDTLVAKLRLAAAGRGVGEVLLLKPGRVPWGSTHITKRFARIVKQIGEDPKRVTSYALRHTHITSQLLAGLPVQLVAKLHDTSATQIEKHYAATIASFADDHVRATMMQRPVSGNVVPMRS